MKVLVGCLVAIALAGAAAAQESCAFAPNDTHADFSLKPRRSAPFSAPLSIEKIAAPPVLTPKPEGGWESSDVLAPAMVDHEGELRLYYSGFDGTTWRTGLARSTDGASWRREPGNPVLDLGPEGGYDGVYIAGNADVVEAGGRTYLYYQATCDLEHGTIALATSDDGAAFTREAGNPVLTPGSPGAWDETGVADPGVFLFDGVFYMVYLGMDRTLTQRLGLARSTDGVVWEKSARNPILDVGPADAFDAGGLGVPTVLYQPPYFYMIYTGRGVDERRNLGLAVSADGVAWRKVSHAPLIDESQLSDWNRSVVADADFLRRGDDVVDVYYGGGDRPEPAENLHGAIGAFRMRFPAGRPAGVIDAAAPWARTATWTEASEGVWTVDSWDGGAAYTAWVAPRAVFDLYAEGKPARLMIDWYVPASASYTSEGPLRISVSVDGRLAETLSFDQPFNGVTEIALNALDLPGGQWSRVEVDASAQIATSNGDGRALSWMLRSIRLE